MSRLDLRRIWRDHNAQFTGSDWAVYYAMPLGVGIALALADVRANQAIIGIIATALSVFCALLFGLLIPIIDQARRLRERQRSIVESCPDPGCRPSAKQEDLNRMEVHARLAEHLFANVSFSILLALLTVLLCVALAMLDLPSDPSKMGAISPHRIAAFRTVSALMYSSALTFVLTVIMLLRRMYVTFLAESQAT